MASKKRYWLMKSEPNVFSIADLKVCKVTCWDGVRNYQARNYMRDEMKIGDKILFYHSSAEPIGIAGLAEVVREGYPDYTAFDPKDVHYDPKSNRSHPTWHRVDVKYVRACKSIIPMARLRQISGLKNMLLLRHGRLSVQPVTAQEWKIILSLPEWG
ncbi:MAG TPA: EVE domain-containing protein [Nitrospiria bacterium]|nr:EVE domain-containing protein [Nitrospiria bacterium]